MKENESEIRNPNKDNNGSDRSILRSTYSSSTNPGFPGNEQATGYNEGSKKSQKIRRPIVIFNKTLFFKPGRGSENPLITDLRDIVLYDLPIQQRKRAL